MQLTDEYEFQRVLRETQVICSPDYGVYVNLYGKNPIKNNYVSFQDAVFLVSEEKYGRILKVEKAQKVLLYAVEIF